jgi:hypothetical protein
MSNNVLALTNQLAQVQIDLSVFRFDFDKDETVNAETKLCIQRK